MAISEKLQSFYTIILGVDVAILPLMLLEPGSGPKGLNVFWPALALWGIGTLVVFWNWWICLGFLDHFPIPKSGGLHGWEVALQILYVFPFLLLPVGLVYGHGSRVSVSFFLIALILMLFIDIGVVFPFCGFCRRDSDYRRSYGQREANKSMARRFLVIDVVALAVYSGVGLLSLSKMDPYPRTDWMLGALIGAIFGLSLLEIVLNLAWAYKPETD